jgi:hypothetical protein
MPVVKVGKIFQVVSAFCGIIVQDNNQRGTMGQ